MLGFPSVPVKRRFCLPKYHARSSFCLDSDYTQPLSCSLLGPAAGGSKFGSPKAFWENVVEISGFFVRSSGVIYCRVRGLVNAVTVSPDQQQVAAAHHCSLSLYNDTHRHSGPMLGRLPFRPSKRHIPYAKLHPHPLPSSHRVSHHMVLIKSLKGSNFVIAHASFALLRAKTPDRHAFRSMREKSFAVDANRVASNIFGCDRSRIAARPKAKKRFFSRSRANRKKSKNQLFLIGLRF